MHRSQTKIALAALLAMAVLLPAQAARAAAYFDEATWLAAVAGRPVIEFPTHAVVVQDAFATRPSLGVPAGQWSGRFECLSFAYPCLGAYRITYTLPFAIVGIAGTLTQVLGYDGAPSLSFFETPRSSCRGPGTSDPHYDCARQGGEFQGFYGATFAATDRITITWPPGLVSADDFEVFRMTAARVVPAPEPGALALLATALGMLLGWRRLARGD